MAADRGVELPDPTAQGVVLLTRRDCHLCAEARAVLAAAAAPVGVGWREIDVDDDPELRAEWGDMVPALLVDGRCVGYHQLVPVRVVAALA
ncbi:glutaredoxin family protein [Nakamurella sp. YIM 132087]|uniref:Glutaredoxin family protein n=1 Tax=Nakamurella alba TaxID=2665158 RepID=A0A7K1FK95_9ACTN|nr:glutaredoxin family protein [Nakamurella alba]MTD14506.1 glutaredoxin family protein [Nakamurella alba]